AVFHYAGAAGWRDRWNKDADRIAPAERRLEISQILRELPLPGIFDGAYAGEPGLRGTGMDAAFVKGRERHVLAGLSLAGFGDDRCEAGQAVGDVVLETGFGLLAVADDVNSKFALLAHRLRHRFPRFPGQRFGIERLLDHAREQQSGQ